MESCLGVEREVSRVRDKITGVQAGQKRVLDEVISAVQQVKQELQNGQCFFQFLIFIHFIVRNFYLRLKMVISFLRF